MEGGGNPRMLSLAISLVHVSQHVDMNMYVLPSQDGMTPLASASYKGNASVVKLLVLANAKTDIQDKVRARAYNTQV